MSYTVAYCGTCRTLQFEPEELTGIKKEQLKELSGYGEFWAHCNVCLAVCGISIPKVFHRVDDLSDL